MKYNAIQCLFVAALAETAERSSDVAGGQGINQHVIFHNEKRPVQQTMKAVHAGLLFGMLKLDVVCLLDAGVAHGERSPRTW
jgi:hypothetical protein